MRVWRGLRWRPAASSALLSSCPGGRERRRRAWEASLSPLERVRQRLAPEEAAAVTDVAPAAVADANPVPVTDVVQAAGSPLRAGELALAELRRRQRGALKLLCRLTAGATLAVPGGLLPHGDIVGRWPGQVVQTAGGLKLLVRRPSLEEYVLLMARSATIAYPKDVSAMLTMLDLHPGDTVLEIGSGSGALSLFLSRAVGSKGRVVSYEIREDHHNLAKKNYRQWRASWEIGHMEEWPDNVDFILKNITTAAEDMKSIRFDAVHGVYNVSNVYICVRDATASFSAFYTLISYKGGVFGKQLESVTLPYKVVLDMLNPQAALPVICPSLKHGGVCAVYLANITQVIALLDRIRTCKLPFLCEKIIDVTHRNWLVIPAKIKNSKSTQITETQENTDEEPQQKEHEEIHFQDQAVLRGSEYDELLSDNVETCSSVPYVARPSYWQDPHSAFLTMLRKFQPPLS